MTKRIGFGFRNFRNYRVRALLYAGNPNWRILGQRRPMSPAPRQDPKTPSTRSGSSVLVQDIGWGVSRDVGMGTYARTGVILLVQDLHVTVVHAATGEILRNLTIDPARTTNPPDAHPAPHRIEPSLQIAGPAHGDLRIGVVVQLTNYQVDYPVLLLDEAVVVVAVARHG